MKTDHSQTQWYSQASVDEAIAEAVAAEREACAQLVESIIGNEYENVVADAIRERK